MSDWIEWNGGECPVDPEEMVLVYHRNVLTPDLRRAATCRWTHSDNYEWRKWDIVRYAISKEHTEEESEKRVMKNLAAAKLIVKEEPQTLNKPEAVKGYEGYNESGGGKLSGDHYYRVNVFSPISPELSSYSAECADIIEALNMTFNEGEAFKALWRLAASRQGRVKDGSKGMQYDADKVAHYGARVAAQTAVKIEEARVSTT